ncbi:pyrroline-5-carboxylate reductase dimerization domain-containing protein [Pseudomonas benzenivorans]|uniref:Pyrroline-5-carboxylate reductase n=1 Tax=Pseudomonas benzenivorans TaxID=556533 RepID=A0ABZ0PSL2_9PSED|nr:pyrroline-5-carboxylate reductase dimerization domain-containing protein [Pseudomonas benzenivorans]WPC04096.1 pyrroline-5-carboxylate reductase dimerization domain-containing protein [Pseudomonas benzenivorans]
MAQAMTVGIIGGGGWLGRAIGAAMLEKGVLAPAGLILSSRSGTLAGFEAWPGVRLTADNRRLAEEAEVIVLSVRPEQFAAVEIDAADKLVISFMAGVSLDTLIARTGSGRVIRAMPNAAAEIGQCYTPWFASGQVSTADKAFTRAMFESCGDTDEVASEADLDYLTGLVGSGAAYPALLAEAMLAHALARGLPRRVAENAVRGVVVGASQLLGRGGMPPAQMVQAMLDYRGTTAAGLQGMIDAGFKQAVDAGLDAAEAAARRMKSRYS